MSRVILHSDCQVCEWFADVRGECQGRPADLGCDGFNRAENRQGSVDLETGDAKDTETALGAELRRGDAEIESTPSCCLPCPEFDRSEGCCTGDPVTCGKWCAYAEAANRQSKIRNRKSNEAACPPHAADVARAGVPPRAGLAVLNAVGERARAIRKGYSPAERMLALSSRLCGADADVAGCLEYACEHDGQG